jgi:hypothetical protein
MALTHRPILIIQYHPQQSVHACVVRNLLDQHLPIVRVVSGQEDFPAREHNVRDSVH